MGRRAADLTTPVPVLGVPASVGLQSWKSTGDRSGGALLQTWGQCNIGVQTSPGISRPPIQLPDRLSNSVTQTSNSCITKETETISLHTKNDNEKRAILRQKTEETKIKKEVTFKALGDVASKDVAGCQKRSGGTYCYAMAIKTKPLIAGTTNSSRPRLKRSTRYINGSVVDAEAIGGISEANDDAEPAKAATSHGRALHHPYAGQSGKPLSLSLAMARKICNHCGGKQSITSRGTILGENRPISDAVFEEKPSKPALTSQFTDTHLQLTHTLNQNQLNSQSSRVKKTQIAGNPYLLYLNEEIRYRRTPHPACPVHSRGSLATLFHTHASSEVTSIKPETILHTETATVTKTAIESRQKNSTINSLTKPMQDNKPHLLESLRLTPQMATAIKTFQTSSKHLKTSSHNYLRDNILRNVCVSVHAAPESPPLYTVAMGTQITSSTLTEKTFNLETMSRHSNFVSQEILHSTDKAQIVKSEHSSNLKLVSSQPDLYKCQEKALSSTADISPAKMSFMDNAAQFPASANPPQKPAPHSLLSTVVPKITLNYKVNPDQITCRRNTDKAVAPQIHSARPNSTNSESALHIPASSTHTISGVSKSSDPSGESPAAPCSKIASDCTLYKNTTCRSIKTELKKATSLAGSLPAPSTERQANVAAFNTCLLQLTETTEVLRNNEVHDKNKAHHKQAPDIRSQDSNKHYIQVVIPSQQSNSVTTPLTSKLQNMSETVNIGSDAKSHHTNPIISPTGELQSDKNKSSDIVINELVVRESEEHENSKCSQVTNLQNCFSPIKSSTFHLHGCLNREQQRLKHYQGYMQTDHQGHCTASPPGKTHSHSDSDTQQFALGAAASHANSKCESNADGQKHPSYSSPPVATQTNCESTFSQTNTQVNPVTPSTGCQYSHFDITLRRQTHTSPEHCVSVPASFTGEGGLPAHTGPEWDFVLQPSALLSKSSPPLHSREVEAISRPYLKVSPAAPQSVPGGTRLSHSHPSDAALLLPPSRQCCRSVGLEQRLKTVEASLAANKDRITTLLNIIQDLETCNAPNSLRRCCKSGLELKNCSTCQKTACIVYSVEYDFRQQEKHFLEVLNHSLSGSNVFPEHLVEPLNLGLLRNVIFKKFSKTKLKSKKLCKTLLKWIPRKIH
ncbi:uncharacterized protein LOC124876701 [Girardinichthys multiradiatus]|uniref:uncharacterized protein LOC124876701 n=1 Tax=Girardinichthys multiradiatus TaxID=208333 RepID=UPI001FAE1771|nr:uncharacterized protein LOC124876701 [Girardinichthys multiradiatus]